MTIVIGMLAGVVQDHSDPNTPAQGTVLLCADTLATYAEPQKSPVTSHPSQGKIYPLPNAFFCGFCDDYYWSHKVATELNSRLSGNVDFTGGAVIDLVKVEVRRSFEYAFKWYRERLLQDEVGITDDEFLHDKKLRKGLRKKADEIVLNRSGEVPAELIIVGQTRQGPMLLKANASEVREGTEFFVSGAAQESAISWLKFRDQRNNMSVARSFYHMVEAKRFVQADQLVGRKSQIVVISPNGTVNRYQDDGETTMKSWFQKFCIVDTEELDGEEAGRRFDEAATKASLSMPLTSRTSGRAQ
jgi:hypothetical protein